MEITNWWVQWGILIIMLCSAVLMAIVQNNFRHKAMKYGQISNGSNKTGQQIALEILHRNGIHNVSVVLGHEGRDNYNPKTNQIQLSPSVFNSASIYAAAVAAHEVGHAIQWAKGYAGVKLRDALVQPVHFITRFSWMLFIFSFFFMFSLSYNQWLVFMMVPLVSIGAMGLFQLVTLPVEFDASKRAKKQLMEMNLVNGQQENAAVKSTLNAAALTYVIAFATTMIYFIFFLMRLLSARR